MAPQRDFYMAASVFCNICVCSQPHAGSTNGTAQQRDELKRLKLVEMRLRHDIQELSAQRDYIVSELQQLHEFRPAIERSAAYAVRIGSRCRRRWFCVYKS